MTYSTIGATTNVVISGVTTVDCHKQVRSWGLFRSLLELLIPSCYCTFVDHHDEDIKQEKNSMQNTYKNRPRPFLNPATTITGTIFGHRGGKKVRFCIQTNPKSTTPILLLELAIPTTILAREMRGGLLRIALESTSHVRNSMDSNSSLLSMPIWNMYCNGRKVGFAVKRRPSKADMEVLGRMETVVVGAGVIGGKELDDRNDQVMYLRGNFRRVRGSSDCETFRLIDPDGNVGQDLSIFFLRSR